MLILNLPQYTYKFYQRAGKSYIFDPIRKKYVYLSKEEWVRQHIINFLRLKGYPSGLIQVEKKLMVYKRIKRIDILVYTTKLKPFLLVEVKNYTQALDEDTFFQISRYNLVLHAPFLMLSNGLRHVFIWVDFMNGTCIRLKDLPDFNSEVC